MPDPITTPDAELIPDLTFEESLAEIRKADPELDEETAKLAAQFLADGDLEDDGEFSATPVAKLAAGKKFSDLTTQEKAQIADEEYSRRIQRKAKGIAGKAAKGIKGAMGAIGGATGGITGGRGPKMKKPKKAKKNATGFDRYGFKESDFSGLLKLSAEVVHGKKFEKLADGSVLVPNVEIMSYLKAGDRPEFKMPGDCDDAWFQRVEATCRLMEAKGKFPRLLRGHNEPGKPAEVIGKLRNVRWESPWLRADVLATEPAAIGKLSRGEFPSRSAEFYYGTAHLHALSLTEGEPGHFEEELSDLALADAAGIDELKKLKAGDKVMRVTLSSPIKLDGGDCAPTGLSPKDAEELFRRLAALESIITANGLTSTPAKPAAKLAAAPAAPVATDEAKALRVQLANHQEAARLIANGCPLNTQQIVNSLSSMTTEEGRAAHLQYLATLKAGPTNVPPSEQSIEGKLREEYRQYKAEFPHALTQSEEMYVRTQLAARR